MNCLPSVIIPDYGVCESADHYEKRKYSLRFVVCHYFKEIIRAMKMVTILRHIYFQSKLFH